MRRILENIFQLTVDFLKLGGAKRVLKWIKSRVADQEVIKKLLKFKFSVSVGARAKNPTGLSAAVDKPVGFRSGPNLFIPGPSFMNSPTILTPDNSKKV